MGSYFYITDNRCNIYTKEDIEGRAQAEKVYEQLLVKMKPEEIEKYRPVIMPTLMINS